MDTNGTTAGSGKKRARGRRLRSPANVRALLAATIRAVENDAAIPTAEKARIIVNASSALLKAIETVEAQQKWQRVADQVRELVRDRDERGAVERRHQ